jgi:glycosyltransferase involved in cell wall biosynthesis
MNRPKVSVCIPTYNYAAFLPMAIESVLNQSFTDHELLIIDDCSHDDTRDVVRKYAAQDKRVRFKINAVNIGMVNNWNLCLKEARGEYIKPLFADDMFADPDALQQMTSVLMSNERVVLVASSWNLVNAESKIIRSIRPFKRDCSLHGEKVTALCLSEQKNFVGSPSGVMFRNRDCDRGFSTDYHQIVDLEMWFHLLEKGTFVHLDKPLCSFRIHPDQQTERNKGNYAAYEDAFLLYDHYMHKSYVSVSRFHKQYIQYDNTYHLWKSYAAGYIDKRTVLKGISERYGLIKFLTYYPLYKIYKPCLKLQRRLVRRYDF